MEEEEEYRLAKNYCLRRLSMQAMLSHALVKFLKDRLISEKTINRVIQELFDLGFLNDRDWSASFVRTQSNKKVGPRAIAQKLAHKGMSREEVAEALKNSWNSEDQKSLIQSLLKSRYAKKNLSDFKEKQKVIASLVRKGFELPIILEVLQFA